MSHHPNDQEIDHSADPNLSRPVRSGLAVAALVLGVLAFGCFPLGIVAVIIGIVAMNKIGDPANRQTGHGMAVAGTVLGGMGMIFGVVAVLVALMLPALSSARHHASLNKSASQLRGVTQSLVSYAEINKGRYPGIGDPDQDGDGWTDVDWDGDGVQDVSGNYVEARLFLMLEKNFFTGELLTSPFESKFVWTSGPVTTQHYSYAALEIGDTAKSYRAVEWKNTINSQAVVLSDRNLGTVRQPQSVSSETPGFWEGSAAFNDGHVETQQSTIWSTKYGSNRHPNDDIFDDMDGSDAYMIYSGK